MCNLLLVILDKVGILEERGKAKIELNSLRRITKQLAEVSCHISSLRSISDDVKHDLADAFRITSIAGGKLMLDLNSTGDERNDVEL